MFFIQIMLKHRFPPEGSNLNWTYPPPAFLILGMQELTNSLQHALSSYRKWGIKPSTRSLRDKLPQTIKFKCALWCLRCFISFLFPITCLMTLIVWHKLSCRHTESERDWSQTITTHYPQRRPFPELCHVFCSSHQLWCRAWWDASAYWPSTNLFLQVEKLPCGRAGREFPVSFPEP